jgi:hypothetical protein
VTEATTRRAKDEPLRLRKRRLSGAEGMKLGAPNVLRKSV